MVSNEKYIRGFLKPQNIPVGRKNKNPNWRPLVSRFFLNLDT
jgi:hypothetical protein